MKRRIFAAICLAAFLSQPLTCFAATEETPTREPFLDHFYPAALNLRGDDWSAYDLAETLGNPFEISMLFSYFPNEITITDDDDELYQAKLQEKLALINGEFELTDNLRDLLLVPADGGHFFHTEYNPNKQFTGTMQTLPYNGVVHTIVITEQYTVQPGDTLSQIILDCGWLPAGAHLYGPDGYLAAHYDYAQTLYPGDVVYWRSEEIRIIDNLYPDIEIDIIPGNFFSHAEPATLLDESRGALSSLPIISDLLEVTP